MLRVVPLEEGRRLDGGAESSSVPGIRREHGPSDMETCALCRTVSANLLQEVEIAAASHVVLPMSASAIA